MAKSRGKYRFSFGPWNISEGADPFGPEVRTPIALGKKMRIAKQLGFEGMQFHDDDAVPELDTKSASQIAKEAKHVKKILDREELVAKFVAPRL